MVWQDDRNENEDVYGRLATTTTTSGSEFTITTATNDQEFPAATFNAGDEEYLVVWEHSNGSDDDVHGRRVSSSGTREGSELTIASGSTDQQRPDVAWDSSSEGYAVVWQHGSTGGDIHGIILDGEGAATEAEATLSEAANAQERPAMAYDEDLRRYLVVWEDYRHSTTHPDVYGQLYAGHTRIIEYHYDPLYRLSSADYSTGESFSYTYDEVGNRKVVTSVTPLSGTVVTTYTFDAANRLSDRQVSDGRSYTYTWSLRGELEKEWTQGVAVSPIPPLAAGLG